MTQRAGRCSAAEVTPPDLAKRFGDDLARVWPEKSSGETCLGVAVSGGPDSLALLLLAAEALRGRIAAATVDHGLRPESAAEAAMVAQLCARRGIPHAVLPVELSVGNMQAEARVARYTSLVRWAVQNGITTVATAHHADDQAETLLMRLNRGSGLAGLAGIRPRMTVAGSDPVAIVRPLLGWRKAELEAVCAAAGVPPARDPSNGDERFDRVAMRQLLAANPVFDATALARSAAHLTDAEEALGEWLALRWAKDVTQSADGLRYSPQGPRYVRLKLLERAIATFGGMLRGSAVAALLDRLEQGEGGNVAGVQVSLEGSCWVLRRENPRRA